MDKFNKLSENKFLLITTVGKRAYKTCNAWVSRSRSFDVLFIYYDLDEQKIFEELSDFFITLSGFKYPSIYKLLSLFPHLLEDYEYFFLPDDDVFLNSLDIDKLFLFAETNKVAICQPSIFEVNCNWFITVHNPYTKYRYVSMVEVMCPLFSKTALKLCLPSFSESQSGWGLESAWAKLLSGTGFKFAIYDGVKAFHSSPLDQTNGSLYKALSKIKINPISELVNISKKYETQIEFKNLDFVYKNSIHRKFYHFLINISSNIPSDNLFFLILGLNLVFVRTLRNFTNDNHIIEMYLTKLKEYHSIDINKLNSSYDENIHLVFSNIYTIFNERYIIICDFEDLFFDIIDEIFNKNNIQHSLFNLLTDINYFFYTHLNFSIGWKAMIYYYSNKFIVDGNLDTLFDSLNDADISNN